jgi:ketosteroid isomerase-like protein
MRLVQFGVLVLSVVLFAPRVSHAQTESDARKGLDAAHREFGRILKSGDAKGIGDLYVTDATFVSPEGVTRGRAAIEARFRKAVSRETFVGDSIEAEQFGSHGPLAYVAGIGSRTWRDKATGKETTTRTRFLIVAKKGSDGVWRFQYVMNVPLQAAGQAR